MHDLSQNVIPTEAAPPTSQEYKPTRGRAEGPLPEADYLIEQSSRLYVQSLLDRMSEGEE